MLTSAQPLADRFAEEGYAVIPRLFDPGEIAEVRRAIDELFEGYDRLPGGHGYNLDRRPDGGGVGNIPAIRDTLRLRPALREARGLAAAVELAGGLTGIAGAELLWDAAVFKQPGVAGETPWHQDEAVYRLSRLRRPRWLVYFWVALDDVDEDAGCIRFVPGSHRGPLLPHRWRHGDPSSSLEVDPAAAVASGVPVPLRAGDATAHHPRTLHSSGPNLSGRWRKAWILGIGAPSSPRWVRELKRHLARLGGRSHGR
jgi:hypothetical protein